MTKIAEAENREGEKFSIFVGLDKELVAQIKKYSMDETDIELQKNTGDRNRFGIGSYEDWYKKERTPFTLVHKNTNALAAIVWLGPKPLHEGCKCHSLGWRSYNPFRGRGIMKSFVNYAMGEYIKNFPDVKFWVKMKKENAGSINLAAVLGFKIDEKYSDENDTVMNKGF